MTAPIMTVDARMIRSSGIGTYISNLLPNIIRNSPWRFVLIGDRVDLRKFDWANNPRVTIRAARAPIYSIAQQLELPRLVPAESRLFWSPHYDIPVFVRGPLLVTVHDMAHLALAKVFGGVTRQTYAKAMMAAVRRRANHILFVSEFTAREFNRLAGPPLCATDVVYLGTDKEWHSPHWRALPSPHPRPYLIYVGNVKPHKNLGGLIEAFATVRQHVPHDLVIVGKREGFLTSDQNLPKAIETDERIVFTGPVSDARLKQYVAHASLLVQPSFYEGFGLPPIEAMACGCPVAVSQQASLPEVCGDGAAYFDPHSPSGVAETISRILSDPEMAGTLREKGFVRAAKFDWDRCAKEVAAIANRFMDG